MEAWETGSKRSCPERRTNATGELYEISLSHAWREKPVRMRREWRGISSWRGLPVTSVVTSHTLLSVEDGMAW